MTDVFNFVHQPLAGDGTITARLASLTGLVPDPSHDTRTGRRTGASDRATRRRGKGRPGALGQGRPDHQGGPRPGSAYAAVMVTGAHGVRMQYDYTHDIAGPATRDRGVAAADPGRRHRHRLRVGRRVDLDDHRHRPSRRAAGRRCRRACSPPRRSTPPRSSGSFGLSGAEGGPSQATGVFDHADPAVRLGRRPDRRGRQPDRAATPGVRADQRRGAA